MVVKIDDVKSLMAAMAENRIGVLEMPGLKLVAGAPERSSLTASSSIRAPEGPPPPVVTKQDAEAAVQAARIEAARQAMEARQSAELKLGGLQAKTANARRKAAGGFTAGPSLGSNIEAVYKESLKTPRAPKPKSG